MNLHKHNLSSKLIYSPYLPGALFFFFGLFIIKDYGISLDEPMERLRGIISTLEILKILNIENALNSNLLSAYKNVNFFDGYFGAFLEYSLISIEFCTNLILGEVSERSSYILRHIFCLLIFSFIGLSSLFKLLFIRYKSHGLAFLGCVLLALTPRIFANSFYDVKDIGFLSFSILSATLLVQFLERRNLKNLLLFSLVTAISINIRTIAVLNIFLAISLMCLSQLFEIKKVGRIKLSLDVILCLLLITLFSFCLWPWLWTAPIENFMLAVRNAANLNTEVTTLFKGSIYAAKDVPFYYIPYWILITTPVIFFPPFFLGVFSAVNILRASIKKASISNANLLDLIAAFSFFAPISLATLLSTPKFDGWRHYYFTYPYFIYFLIGGVLFLSKRCAILNKLSSLFLIPLTLCYLLVINFHYHPYQHSYFNFLAGQKIESKFDMDYWGLGSKQAIQYILNNSQNSFNKIFIASDINIAATLKNFYESDKNKIIIVDRPEDADYIITNYRRDTFISENYPLLYSEFINEKKFGGSIFKIYINKNIGRESLKINTPIPFSKNSQGEKFLIGIGASSYYGSGWSYPEAMGVWSEGPSAKIITPLPNAYANSMEILITPFLPNTNYSQPIDIYINNQLIRTMILNQKIEYAIEIPLASKLQLPYLIIEFKIHKSISPEIAGLSNDKRNLGIFLNAITFKR